MKLKNTLISLIISLSASAQTLEENGLQKKVEGIIAELDEAAVSICAKTAGGKTLVDIEAENMAVPASNMKLITTGAALHVLGPEYRFETKVGYSGEISPEGVLNGDVYIIGGADPTLGSKDSIAAPLNVTFAQWEKIIRLAGIRQIEGRVIGDGRYFDGMPEHPTWLWNDIGTYYGAGATGLMFYENMQSFAVSAGPEVGSPLNIKPSYPEATWMQFRYDCKTGKAGTGDQLYMYTSDLAPIAEIRGTFGVDRAAKRVDCSNKFPEYTCAQYFVDYLRSKGITCTEGAADLRLRRDIEPSEATIIGSTFSPSLKRIAFETNHASNNLYAETLYRTLGKEKTGSACYDSCSVAINDILKSLNINTLNAQIADGSGLSRQNYISADIFCDFLKAMMASPHFDDYIYTLPSPGKNGTLAYNLSKTPIEVKSRIKVKSGSMNGVRCYSGYILPADGSQDETIIFSILVNNSTAPTWKLRPLLDKIMLVLATM